MGMGRGEKAQIETALAELAQQIAEVMASLSALEARVAAIEAKRGPGRPPKNEQGD